MLSPSITLNGPGPGRALDADRIPDDLKKKSIAKILASSTFKRSEQLRRLFDWLGQASLDGADSFKEYEIGVRALKRPEDFDPQTDSIVRREMCRLREKLKQYYSDEGSAEPLCLDCSNGYQIRFRWSTTRSYRPAGRIPCLLILPIRAASDSDEWACELFDELFVALGSSGLLQLVSQTTSLRYAGRTGDVRDFAAEAGAELVIEGRVRREDSARTTSVLWLVDGKSGRIRSQCLLPNGNAAEAGKQVVEWLRERPELERASQVPGLTMELK